MRYLLDTNVWVDYLNQRYPNVTARIRSADPEELGLSTVVLAELRYGAEKSQRPARNHERIDILVQEVPCVDFDQPAAAAFGRLRTTLEAAGNPIGPYDTMIAAQALSRGLVLVTDNFAEFGRVGGLPIENWRK